MREPLSHSTKPHAAATRPTAKHHLLLRGHVPTRVSDLERQMIIFSRQQNEGSLTSRMAMHIRKTFLYDAKNREFYVFWQPL